MYKLHDIKQIHLEITSLCQASCPMCARNISGGIQSPYLKTNEITLETFKKWFSDDFVKQLEKLYMCGNYGDPIIAKDTLKIFQHIRNLNPYCNLSMNTNGSARDDNFWRGLAEAKVKVHFGIDGMSDTHYRYRRNTDWHKIINNAMTFISHNGYAIWDMLVFKHNEHQVEACEKFGKELGFMEFHSKNTTRFRGDSLEVLDDQGVMVDELFPTSKSHSMKSKINFDSKHISCKVKAKGSLYIGANGNVTPCCYIDREFMAPHSPTRIDLMTRIGKSPNLHENSLLEIFGSDYFTKIQNTWSDDPLKECSKQCGRFKKFEAQYE